MQPPGWHIIQQEVDSICIALISDSGKLQFKHTFSLLDRIKNMEESHSI